MARRLLLLPTLLLLAVALLATSGHASDAFSMASFDDHIQFELDFGARPADAAERELVQIHSADNEQFECGLPVPPKTSPASSNQLVSGMDPRTLLEQIRDACVYRLEVYWAYEFCLNKFIRQYHEEKDPKDPTKRKTTEFMLGRFASYGNYDPDNIPTLTLEDVSRPYYSEVYNDGAMCDLTGKPREVEVRYLCNPSVVHEITSFSEVATCKYEMLVSTSFLCANKAFQAPTRTSQKILCWPKTENSPVRPAAWDALQTDMKHIQQGKLVKGQAAIKGAQEQTLKDEAKRRQQAEVDAQKLKQMQQHQQVHQQAQQQAQQAQQYYAQQQQQQHQHAQQQAQQQHNQQHQQAQQQAQQQHNQQHNAATQQQQQDPKVARERLIKMLKANYCFTGGAGYWQFEFCIGKHVKQFHRRPQGGIDQVMLGLWNEDYHRLMFRQQKHSHQKADKADGSLSLTHFFSQGEYCPEAGANRKVKVKMSCAKTLEGDQVALTLEEPSVCEYVLRVRARLFCDIQDMLDKDDIIQF